MKAAVVTAPGARPTYGEFADPGLAEGRQILRMVAAGLHPIVRALAAGDHYASDGGWPLVPGIDRVAETDDGTLVYTGGVQAPYGTMSELVSVPAGRATPLPEGADPIVVAASLNPGLSTWVPLQRIAGVAEDAMVLVTAASGVAGRMGVQNARALGARQIIAIGRDNTRLEPLRTLGAETTLAWSGDRSDDVAALEQVLAGRRPTIVLDLAWGWVAETLFDVLASRSLASQSGSTHYVQIGSSAGATAILPGATLRSTPVTLIGHGLGSASATAVGGLVPGYLELLAAGTVRVDVERFPLADVAAAWAPETTGVRRVLTP